MIPPPIMIRRSILFQKKAGPLALKPHEEWLKFTISGRRHKVSGGNWVKYQSNHDPTYSHSSHEMSLREIKNFKITLIGANQSALILCAINKSSSRVF
jgi:hypothetical protein